MNFCKLDHWPEAAKKDVSLQQYWFAHQELTVQQGLLLFQSCLVIPAELQEEMLQRLHQGHQGVVKCRALPEVVSGGQDSLRKLKSVVSVQCVRKKENSHQNLCSRPRLQTTRGRKLPWTLTEWTVLPRSSTSRLLLPLDRDCTVQ